MELLEGVSARIDTPHFDEFHMIFFMDLIFDIPQFHRFIGCTRSLGPLNPAQLQLSEDAVRIFLGSSSALFWQEIKCKEPDKGLPKKKKKTRGCFFSKWALGMD